MISCKQRPVGCGPEKLRSFGNWLFDTLSSESSDCSVIMALGSKLEQHSVPFLRHQHITPSQPLLYPTNAPSPHPTPSAAALFPSPSPVEYRRPRPRYPAIHCPTW